MKKKELKKLSKKQLVDLVLYYQETEFSNESLDTGPAVNVTLASELRPDSCPSSDELRLRRFDTSPFSLFR